MSPHPSFLQCQSSDPLSARSHWRVTHGFVQAAPDTRTGVPGCLAAVNRRFTTQTKALIGPPVISNHGPQGGSHSLRSSFHEPKKGGEVNERDVMIGKITGLIRLLGHSVSPRTLPQGTHARVWVTDGSHSEALLVVMVQLRAVPVDFQADCQCGTWAAVVSSLHGSSPSRFPLRGQRRVLCTLVQSLNRFCFRFVCFLKHALLLMSHHFLPLC